MTMSKRGMKLLAFIMAVAIVLSGLVYSPKSAKAADSEVPTVKVLGATLKLGETTGKQSMRMAIEISKASLANGCAMELTVGGKSVYIRTSTFENESTQIHNNVYSKDLANDSIVYAVVLKGIPQNYFDQNIGIKGHVQYEAAVASSDLTNKTVEGIVAAMNADYPDLNININADGVLCAGDKVLTEDNLVHNSYVDVTKADSAAFISYDDHNNLIVNDTSDDTSTTELHFPLPYAVKPGQQIEVTISGKNWGSPDFRIWTVPSNDKGSGSYVENNGIYLNPTINEEDNSYTGTVTLQAKGTDCDYLTFKPGYSAEGNKIKDLVISSITVKYLPIFDNLMPEATPLPTRDPATNLITNGDFSNGNTGWSTNYYTSPTVTDGYGVFSGRWNNYSAATYKIERRFAEGDVVDFEFDVKLVEDYAENGDFSFVYWFATSDAAEGSKNRCYDNENNIAYGNAKTWTRVQGSYTVPKYTDNLTIYIAEGPGYSETEHRSDFLLDNLHISTENAEPPVPTASPTPAPTAVPTAVPTPIPPREPATVEFDPTKIVISGGAEGTTATLGDDGSVSYELEAGFSGMIIPLPEEYVLGNGQSFYVAVDYESTGCNARAYLLKGTADDAKSNIIGPGTSPLEGTMTATDSGVNYIFIKASSYNTKFTSLKINSIALSDNAPDITSGSVDLSTFDARGIAAENGFVVNPDGSIQVTFVNSYAGSTIAIPEKLQGLKYVELKVVSSKNGEELAGANQIAFRDTDGNDMTVRYQKGVISFIVPDDKKLGSILFNAQDASAEAPQVMTISYINMSKVYTLDLADFTPRGNQSSTLNADGSLTILYHNNYTGSSIDLSEYANCTYFEAKITSAKGETVQSGTQVSFRDSNGDEIQTQYIGDWNPDGVVSFTVPEGKTPGSLVINTQSASADEPVTQTIYYIKAR